MARKLFVLVCLLLPLALGSEKVPETPLPVKEQIAKEYSIAINAIYALAIRLQALLGSTESGTPQNLIVSPISIAAVIGQLMLGAKGNFQDNLYNLLTIAPDDSSKYARWNYNDGTQYILKESHSKLHIQLGRLLRSLSRSSQTSDYFNLESANGLFFNNQLKLKDVFQKNLKMAYLTEIFDMDFAQKPMNSQMFINLWGEKHTNGLIKNMLTHAPSSSTGCIFANSLYFNADWETPFSYQVNQNKPFHISPNHTTNVTYMVGELEEIPYIHSKELQATLVALPYKENKASMYIVLPDKNHKNAYDIHKFCQDMKASTILGMVSNAKLKSVTLSLPKISYSTTLDLLNPLKTYASYKQTKSVKSRVKSVDDVDEQVDDFIRSNKTKSNQEIILNDATLGEDLVISDMYQQLSFKVDEKGTEAAAVTVAITDRIGSDYTLRLNRPFFFFIRHEETTAPLFWGVVADPSVHS